MGISGKYKVEMIVEGYKTQALEGMLERKEGEDAGTGWSAATLSQRSERGDSGEGREERRNREDLTRLLPSMRTKARILPLLINILREKKE